MTIDVLVSQMTTKRFLTETTKKSENADGYAHSRFIESDQYFFQKNTSINRTNNLPEKRDCAV